MFFYPLKIFIYISCIYYLYSSNALTATDLCERCEEDKATISRALDYLEKNGYLTCEAKSAKRYKSPLVLTEKGVEVGERIAEKINKILDRISGELTEEKRLEFYHSLALISKALDNIANKQNGDYL